MLSREQILAAVAGDPVKVDLPGLGECWIKPRAAEDYPKLGEKYDLKTNIDAQIAEIIECVVDSSGKPVFRAEDFGPLHKVRGGIVVKLSNEIARINGFGDDLEKNSEATQT